MERKILFSDKSLYRDDFRVTGFHFGSDEKTVCIVGSTRGNENQQLFTVAMLIRELMRLEKEGKLNPDKGITVIPCCNPYSINIKKRFWPIDNTDINRMFPGYDKGETTQRIAASIFENVRGYQYGIQFASFYRSGYFIPHVRFMDTGYYNDTSKAEEFGLPYVVIHTPRPFDTTTLNYNWQVFETQAFSVYTTNTPRIYKPSAEQGVKAVLRFLKCEGLIYEDIPAGVKSVIVTNDDFIPVRSAKAGFFYANVKAGFKVRKGGKLATIMDSYTLEVLDTLYSPVDGTVAFVYDEALTYADTALIKVCTK